MPYFYPNLWWSIMNLLLFGISLIGGLGGCLDMKEYREGNTPKDCEAACCFALCCFPIAGGWCVLFAMLGGVAPGFKSRVFTSGRRAVQRARLGSLKAQGFAFTAPHTGRAWQLAHASAGRRRADLKRPMMLHALPIDRRGRARHRRQRPSRVPLLLRLQLPVRLQAEPPFVDAQAHKVSRRVAARFRRRCAQWVEANHERGVERRAASMDARIRLVYHQQ